MFNTTQLLTIAGVPVARHVDVLDSLTLANERAKGLLFQKIKTRYLLADRLSKLLEWEDDRLCASGAWLLLSTEPWYLGLRIARRIGFEIDNIFGGDDTPRRWFPIKGYELRAPVTSSVLPDQDRLDMSLKKWEKPYFVTDKETGNIYTAIPGDAITKDIY